MNEIPYVTGYLVAAVLGALFVWLMCGVAQFGAWGIVSGQALSQILYNNWKWPMYLCQKIETTYPLLWAEDIAYWISKLRLRS